MLVRHPFDKFPDLFWHAWRRAVGHCLFPAGVLWKLVPKFCRCHCPRLEGNDEKMCRAERLLSIFHVHVPALSRGSVARAVILAALLGHYVSRSERPRNSDSRLFRQFPFSLFSTSPLVTISFVSVFSSSRSAVVCFPRQSLPPRSFLEERHRRRHLETRN